MNQRESLALDVAENVLLADELSTLLVDPPLILVEEDMKYPHNTIGDDDIRAAIAALWNETCHLEGNHALAGAQTVCTPGASAALYFHGLARLKPGQSVIIPSPHWNNFDRIYHRLGIPIIRLPVRDDGDSQVNLDDLAALHEKQRREDKPPGLLLLTNPHNPLGTIESPGQLENILDWVIGNTAMDVVVDEIYAHTLHGNTTFTSVMALAQSLENPERIHSVWGFAKDFGLSGWMAGVLFTRSQKLVNTVSSGYARFSPFDKLKTRVIRRLMLEGGEGRSPRQLLALFDQRLRDVHQACVKKFRDLRIPCNEKAQGSPFFWLDLREWLAPDFEKVSGKSLAELDKGARPGMDLREHRLQRCIDLAAGVSLVRGQVLYKEEPGYMRMCFTAARPDAVLAAVDRLGECLQAWR